MAKIDFYFHPMSRARMVRWMLEEVGAPYEERLLNYGPEMEGADFRALNPMGKVPTIVHGRNVVTEAAAICAYLADVFPEAGLGPRTDRERAAYYRWMFFAAGPYEMAVTARQFGMDPDEEQARVVGFGTYGRTLDALRVAVPQTGFLCGERFTAADVYLGSQVLWGLEFGTLPEEDRFSFYAERLRERETYARAAERDDALAAAAADTAGSA